MVLAAPGTVAAHASFTARLHLLTEAEGGRHSPVTDGYRPQFYLRTADVPGRLVLAAPAAPGDTVEVGVVLGSPAAVEPGLGFAVREGGRTVAAGTVLAV